MTHLIANHCGLKAHEFIYHLGNCHIYDDHLDILKIQAEREAYPFSTLKIDVMRENINDYVEKDFVISDYTYHPAVKMEMRK